MMAANLPVDSRSSWNSRNGLVPHRMVSQFFAVAATTAFLTLGGCISTMNGTSQEVTFATIPSGATVQVEQDGEPPQQGIAPVTFDLRRASATTITAEKKGFERWSGPLEWTKGSVAGNWVMGGLIGYAVDSDSISRYYTEDEMTVTLKILSSDALRNSLSAAEVEAILDEATKVRRSIGKKWAMECVETGYFPSQRVLSALVSIGFLPASPTPADLLEAQKQLASLGMKNTEAVIVAEMQK